MKAVIGTYRAELWPSVAHVHVPSRSQQGTVYLVVVEGGVVSCPCPGYGYRNHCAHSVEVGALITMLAT